MCEGPQLGGSEDGVVQNKTRHPVMDLVEDRIGSCPIHVF